MLNSSILSQRILSASFLLMGLLGIFTFLHLSLLLKANDGSLLGTSFLYWAAILAMVWSKRKTLNYSENSIFAIVLGAILLGLILLKSSSITNFDPFLRLLPFLASLGLGLLASGFGGLKQYWRELIILGFLIPPPTLLAEVMDTSLITAQITTLLLWYCGVDVAREGVFILIPQGGVEVYPGCSGLETMFQLLGLSVLFLFYVETPRLQKILLPLVAITIAFVMNVMRVGIMVVLSTPATPKGFEYWHKGDGSLVFSLISVTLLGCYCLFILKDDTSEIPKQTEE